MLRRVRIMNIKRFIKKKNIHFAIIYVDSVYNIQIS